MSIQMERHISTQHALLDDYPWIEMSPKIETRVLQARPDDHMIMIQTRAHPGAISMLHRHLGPVFGLTQKGAWGHHPSEFPFRPGSYICEPLHELHRFHNGPDISETFFVYHGDVEIMDDSGKEVLGRSNAATLLAHYFQQCESRGLPRPNVLK